MQNRLSWARSMCRVFAVYYCMHVGKITLPCMFLTHHMLRCITSLMSSCQLLSKAAPHGSDTQPPYAIQYTFLRQALQTCTFRLVAILPLSCLDCSPAVQARKRVFRQPPKVVGLQSLPQKRLLYQGCWLGHLSHALSAYALSLYHHCSCHRRLFLARQSPVAPVAVRQ